MKNIYTFNFLSRFLFFMLTPFFFQYFALGFIWHSIYWGVITFVVLLWSAFILISPLFGRIGCGWFCFMGAATDFGGTFSFFKTKWKKPIIWTRLLMITTFLASAFAFYFMNKAHGITHGFDIIPGFLKPELNSHYLIIWMIDISAAFFTALFLDKRWACKNFCMIGSFCSMGASRSRLIPAADAAKCNQCRKCEKECPVGIPIVDYIKSNNGMVTNAECILCGKCVKICKSDALKLKFVWNRKKYKGA